MSDLNDLELPALAAHLMGDWRVTSSPLRRLLELARDEDLGSSPAAFTNQSGLTDASHGLGDITTHASITTGANATARMVTREDLVVAGLACLPAVAEVFARHSPGDDHGGPASRVRLTLASVDGRRVSRGSVLAEFSGPLADILAIERTALNLVSRLSGVATLAARFVDEIGGAGRARIYDTRKTTPGMRVLEKYAVRCGGAMCHRIGLFDAVLLKDNHLAGVAPDQLPAFVTSASARARELARQAGQSLAFIELEVDTLDQLGRVLGAGGCGVGIILLDNMSLDQLRQAVELRDRSGLAIELEASGGVRLDTVRAIAQTGVERISAGAITHQAVSRDIGLDID